VELIKLDRLLTADEEQLLEEYVHVRKIGISQSITRASWNFLAGRQHMTAHMTASITYTPTDSDTVSDIVELAAEITDKVHGAWTNNKSADMQCIWRIYMTDHALSLTPGIAATLERIL
jgi:hypothetical protein